MSFGLMTPLRPILCSGIRTVQSTGRDVVDEIGKRDAVELSTSPKTTHCFVILPDFGVPSTSLSQKTRWAITSPPAASVSFRHLLSERLLDRGEGSSEPVWEGDDLI